MSKQKQPTEIFARIAEPENDEPFLDARETAEEFDEEGPVGRYVLAEVGEITIEKAFVPKKGGA